MNGVTTRLSVADFSDVSEVRRTGASMAARLGFNETAVGELSIAITEAATNLLKHATRGEILLMPVESHEPQGLQRLVLDKGPGMENFAQCLQDGYSTAGSPGTGLGAISRMAESLDVYSRAGDGTAIAARFWPNRSNSQRPRSSKGHDLRVDGLSVAMRGEPLCGDAWCVRRTASGLTILVVDGLGHGALAEEAARLAAEVFQSSALGTPAEMLDAMHRGLRSTRGASALVVSLNLESRILRVAGLGNIAGAIVTGAEVRHLVSMNGTLGHQIRTVREFDYPWNANSTLILHSDGVSARWDLGSYPGLAEKAPILIAGVLYRDRAREHDDATVVAVRHWSDE